MRSIHSGEASSSLRLTSWISPIVLRASDERRAEHLAHAGARSVAAACGPARRPPRSQSLCVGSCARPSSVARARRSVERVRPALRRRGRARTAARRVSPEQQDRAGLDLEQRAARSRMSPSSGRQVAPPRRSAARGRTAPRARRWRGAGAPRRCCSAWLRCEQRLVQERVLERDRALARDAAQQLLVLVVEAAPALLVEALDHARSRSCCGRRPARTAASACGSRSARPRCGRSAGRRRRRRRLRTWPVCATQPATPSPTRRRISRAGRPARPSTRARPCRGRRRRRSRARL